MIKTFTTRQQEAIEERKEQLQKIIDGSLKPEELANITTQKIFMMRKKCHKI